MKEIRAELGAALERFEAAGQTIEILFRDDDVDEDEDSLRRLLDLFLERTVPVNLEVIPGRLTRPAALLLRRHLDRQPDLIEIDQHGWMHLNHEREGRKFEFGPSRSFDQQLADIASGRRALEAAFGGEFSAVFTPPWNRCTAETYRALDQLGFRVLSGLRGRHEVRGYRFREVSVTLDLFRWQGGASLRPPEELVRELVQQLGRLDPVGIMLHHKVMDQRAFDLLACWLDELRRCPVVNFHTFRSWLRNRV
jgi:peptidoglycan/xylan/chitin deacetylase (PgdA/CDA1 family)